MPWRARSCFVVTPCVHSPSGWVRRRCSQQELVIIFDIPGVLKPPLSPNLIKTLINDTSVLPSKVIASFLDLIPDHNQALEGSAMETSLAPGIITSKGMNHHDDPFVDKVQDRELRNSKAAKNDDAPVPEYLWNDVAVPCSSPTKIGALPIIRLFALRWWWRHTTEDFLKWLKLNDSRHRDKNEYLRNLEAGRDCIH
jgi:hypothetical protein